LDQITFKWMSDIFNPCNERIALVLRSSRVAEAGSGSRWQQQTTEGELQQLGSKGAAAALQTTARESQDSAPPAGKDA